MESPFDAGRTAAPDELLRALPGAPPVYLDGALANPALSPQHVLVLLKNPAAAGPHIVKVSQNADWMKVYDVKAAIVQHPKTPRALAMNLVSHLWWRDLLRVADRAILAPPLRRTAERLLAIRLQEMALGEKITLARIAGRGVIGALRREGDPMVIRALLQNPRLLEEDALAIVCAPRTPAVVLRVLAEDERFAPRPTILKAIARHPQTPRAVALRILQRLSTRDLKELAHSAKAPSLVKVAAQRLIEARRKRDGAGSGRDGGAGSDRDPSSQPPDSM